MSLRPFSRRDRKDAEMPVPAATSASDSRLVRRISRSAGPSGGCALTGLPSSAAQLYWMPLNLLDDTVVAEHGVGIAIVGAGVIGLSIAYHLTQRGLPNVT